MERCTDVAKSVVADFPDGGDKEGRKYQWSEGCVWLGLAEILVSTLYRGHRAGMRGQDERQWGWRAGGFVGFLACESFHFGRGIGLPGSVHEWGHQPTLQDTG